MIDRTDDEIKSFMRDIGSRGGKTTGQTKRRSDEHYRKMVNARNVQRAAARIAAVRESETQD